MLLLTTTRCMIRYYGPMQLGIYRTERMRKVNAWSDRPQVFHTHLPLSHIPKVRTHHHGARLRHLVRSHVFHSCAVMM